MLSITRSAILSMTRLYSPYHKARDSSSNTKLLKYQKLTATEGLGHLYLSNYARSMKNHYKHRRNFSVNSSAQPGAPPPSSSLSWLLGVVLTIVLPFVTNKWGSLLKIKTEVDTVVESIEEIVDVVEKVAEVVDKVAEDISDHLPEGGKLKKMVDFVEDMAEETAKDAHAIGDAIDKFQEVEDKVENVVDALGIDGKEIHKESENKKRS